jgi:hypothetical protein
MMVYEAIRRGQLVVNLPVLSIIVGGGILSFKLIPGPWFLVGPFAAITIAWLWWSLAVPRWRLWALRLGCDPDDLQKQGVEAGLVWPRGSFFEKTELPPRIVNPPE